MKHHRSLAGPRTLVAIGLALTLIAGACGGDDDAAATTTAPATAATATTTTAAATTTTTTTTATTTPTAATTTTAAATTTQATTTTRVDTNALASGSGCTPGTDVLPDGEWFGYVDSAAAAEIDFDLACWFTGDAAILATAEDGLESPPPNDYYVRNVNPQLRTVEVSAGAQVEWLPNPGAPDLETIAYDEWLAARDDSGLADEDLPGVWLTIAGGDITKILEQFVP